MNDIPPSVPRATDPDPVARLLQAPPRGRIREFDRRVEEALDNMALGKGVMRQPTTGRKPTRRTLL